MKKNVGGYFILSFIMLTTGLFASEKGTITTLNRIQVDKAYTPQVLGLFIGIDSYQDPLWHNLKYPSKDVTDMVDFFENSDALNLDYKMVLNQAVETTRDYILNHALDTFEMKNSSEKDVVIAYISGHGTLAHELITVMDGKDTSKKAIKRPYVVTSDTVNGKVSDSAIALDKIISWFDKLRSRRKILILDLCHSGLGKSQISPDDDALIRSEKGILYTPMEDSWASIILSACPMGGTSFEDDKLKNSVYTHFLIEGMEKGDLNGDGAVSISEAHNYAIDHTRQYTWEHKGTKQIPTAYSRILGKDPVFVSGRQATHGAPVLFSFNSANDGVELYVDNLYQGMFPKGVKIHPGEHKIECRHEGRTLLYDKINASPGQEYMMPQMLDAEKCTGITLLADMGYRFFAGSDYSDSLVPNSPSIGMTLYYQAQPRSCIAWSAGMTYASNKDLTQVTGQIGVKYSRFLGNSRLLIGPELMGLSFNYDSNVIESYKVDKTMLFLCPGADFILFWEYRPSLTISTGLGAYYLPYSRDGKTTHILLNQFRLSMGYSF